MYISGVEWDREIWNKAEKIEHLKKIVPRQNKKNCKH